MRVEFTKEKVMMYHGDYYLALWKDGTLRPLSFNNDTVKDRDFTAAENKIFDAMYKSYINHDYGIVA